MFTPQLRSTVFIYYLYSELVVSELSDHDFLLLPTKADPEIELRFLLRQFNRRLRMDQLKEIIKIAKEDSQKATLKLMEELKK
ncbi:MAG: hypothetical protein EZS28_029857 [Streblomastix strix]|uniref:Uncharacterized protein n=1 Tax=Streblomastix strix TaxID=222440 RepID=A0A5J4UVC9_9EUKA|nr:MAG: hypothetical protein EZS28_029857 [Streblomastix strix]